MSDSTNESTGEDLEMRIYIKPGCPWCVSVLAYLDENAYEYTKIDVTRDAEAFSDMYEIFGVTLAPSMIYGSLKLADFGVEELVDFLDEHGICAGE